MESEEEDQIHSETSPLLANQEITSSINTDSIFTSQAPRKTSASPLFPKNVLITSQNTNDDVKFTLL